MKRKLFIVVFVLFSLLQSTCFAFGSISSINMYTKWMKIDNRKIVLYLNGDARYVIETKDDVFAVPHCLIGFLSDTLHEGDAMVVNGMKVTVFKITEI